MQKFKDDLQDKKVDFKMPNIDFNKKFIVDLYFDETVTQDRSIIGRLTSTIQTKHFQLKFIDKSLDSSQNPLFLKRRKFF